MIISWFLSHQVHRLVPAVIATSAPRCVGLCGSSHSTNNRAGCAKQIWVENYLTATTLDQIGNSPPHSGSQRTYHASFGNAAVSTCFLHYTLDPLHFKAR